MAHNVTERDGMFTVRQAAWWDLDGSHTLEDYPTRKEAQQIAHPWEPVTEPVYRRVPVLREVPDGLGGTATIPGEEYQEIPTAQAIVRSDDGHTLGVVSDTYEPVSNTEMYDIAEALQGESSDVKFETGGSLKGGSKVWLLLRLNEPLVLRNDPLTATIPYYGLQNSFDGSGAFRGQCTMTRIVCDNTSQMADLDARARGTEFVFRHTVNVKERIEEAREALKGWRNGVREYRLMQEHLLDVRVSPEQVREFVERFIPMPPPHAVSPRVVGNVERAHEQMYGILNGPTIVGSDIDGTAYSLVQASVEYLNHARKARSKESRFQRAYLNRDRITTDAVDLVKEIAYV